MRLPVSQTCCVLIQSTTASSQSQTSRRSAASRQVVTSHGLGQQVEWTQVAHVVEVLGLLDARQVGVGVHHQRPDLREGLDQRRGHRSSRTCAARPSVWASSRASWCRRWLVGVAAWLSVNRSRRRACCRFRVLPRRPSRQRVSDGDDRFAVLGDHQRGLLPQFADLFGAQHRHVLTAEGAGGGASGLVADPRHPNACPAGRRPPC